LIHVDLDPRDPYDIMTELLEAQKTQEEAIEDIGAVIAEIAGG
jgi:Trp operon repressor